MTSKTKKRRRLMMMMIRSKARPSSRLAIDGEPPDTLNAVRQDPKTSKEDDAQDSVNDGAPSAQQTSLNAKP